MQMHPASRNSSKVVMETNAFTRMHKLRLLQLSDVQLSGRYGELPAGLRWFSLSKFPLASLPSDFPLERLVALEMCYSSLRQLWRGIKYLPSLKILNLSHSHEFTEIPDFSCIPNLDRLILEDCTRLINVHENIGLLERLTYLSVKDCKNLRNIPENISILPFLETLIISGCSNLGEFPTEMMRIQSLKVFQADGVPIHRLLVTTSCSSPIPVISWASYLPKNLVNLSLRNCNLSDDDFPRDVANLFSLQSLDLSGNPISRLPDCIRDLTDLQYLFLDSCKKLKSLLRLPTGLVELRMARCTSLEKGLYEDGIFSTFLPGDQVPGQFSHRSRGSSISFTVPSLSNLNIRGLNIFSVVTKSNNNDSDLITNVVNIDGSVYLAITVVSNNSSGLKWVYGPTYFGVPREGKDVIWLSHWRFGNRLKGGDEMTILIYTKSDFKVKECGIQLVYYDDKDPEEITSTELIVAANLDDPCFLRAGVSPTIGFYPLDGITFQCDHTGIEGNIDLIRDINEKSEKKQGAAGDLILKHAAQSGSNSNSNKRGFFIGWKGIMMATVFLLSLPLVARPALFQHRKKQQSTSPP